ncbi:unknown [Prevotella sp. CAG:255]|nr:unknown [Prevotella sp. CAG:255]
MPNIINEKDLKTLHQQTVDRETHKNIYNL